MKAEVYVGIYELKDGKVEVPKPSLCVIWPYFGVDSTGRVWADPRIHLVVDDGENSFWPCIIRMTPKEARELSDALRRMLEKIGEFAESKEEPYQIQIWVRGEGDEQGC